MDLRKQNTNTPQAVWIATCNYMHPLGNRNSWFKYKFIPWEEQTHLGSGDAMSPFSASLKDMILLTMILLWIPRK